MHAALVGYGSIAREHVRALLALRGSREHADLQLYGVAGRLQESTEAFAREFGLTRATTELDDLLADPAVDAVVICSPTEVHANQTARALQAGKHVLCEIPLATSLTETDQLIALSKQVDRRLMVCHTQRYHPALREARRMVETGEIHPHAIVSRYLFLRRENVNWVGRRRSWTDNLLWHHGCHAVDAALWLLGATEVEVTAQVALPGEDLGIPMDLTIAMRTPRDQIITVVMSYSSHLPIHDYLVIGEETTLLFADDTLRSPDGVLVPAGATDPLSSGLARQDADFFAAVRDGREPPISGHAVRPAMAALQQAQEILDARLHAAGPDARHPLLP